MLVLWGILLLTGVYCLWKYRKKLPYSLLNVICLVLLLVVIFIDLAILSPNVYQDLSLAGMILILGFNILVAFLLIFVFAGAGSLRAGNCPLDFNVKNLIKSPIFMIVAIYVFVKLFYLDTMFRWDGAWYFCQLIKSVENFNLYWSSFIQQFNWYGHPSMGYASFMALGQFIDLGNHHIANMQNLLLSLLAIYSFYKIIVYLYQGISKVETFLVTALFAFNPLFFGVSLSFGIDFPLIVFWLAAMYALLYNRIILFMLFATLLVFTKETGVLLYFIFLLYIFVVMTVRFVNKNSFVSNRDCLVDGWSIQRILGSKGSLLSLLVPAALFLGYLALSRGELWGAGALSWDSSGMHTFGLNTYVIMTRLYQMFMLNFSWIQSLIIVFFLICGLSPSRDKSKVINAGGKDFLKITLVVFLGFIAFNLLFITYTHPRYVLLSVFFMLLFGHYALLNLFRKENIRILVLALMVILSVAQTFKTIDPISKEVFGVSNFGKHQVLTINPADGLIYNTEFTVIDKLFNKLNKELHINESSTILLGEVEWMSHYNGAGHHTAIYVDRSYLKRTFKTDNAFRPKVCSIWELSSHNRPNEAYYVYLWFGDEAAEVEQVKKYYQITETKKIDHKGYYFILYKLEHLVE